MAKKIILKVILPIIVFILAAFSVFWHVKTGEIKKNLEALLKSNTRSTVGSISSKGFPFSHVIEINDISLGYDNDISKGNIVIDKIITQSSVFGSEFDVSLLGNIIVNSEDSENTIRFNSAPEIKVGVDGYDVSSLSYKDDGYKIYNVDNNTIFYVGDSSLSVGLVEGKDDEYSFKASFSNISSFDIFSLGEVIEVAADEIKEVKEDVASDVKDKVATATEDAAPANIGNIDVDESGKVAENSEVKDVAVKKEEEKVEVVQETKIKTNRDLKVELKFLRKFNQSLKKTTTRRVDISDIELYSPLFKVNVSGNYDERDGIDMVFKVKNIDNILIYVRKFISSLIPSNLETIDTEVVIDSNEVEEINAEAGTNAENTESGKEEEKSDIAVDFVEEKALTPIPEEIVTNLITEIAAKNPNTNDQFSEFKLIGNNLGFAVNEVTFNEVAAKLEPVMHFFLEAFVGNEELNKAIDQQKINNSLSEQNNQEVQNLDLDDIKSPEATQPLEGKGSSQDILPVEGSNGDFVTQQQAVPTINEGDTANSSDTKTVEQTEEVPDAEVPQAPAIPESNVVAPTDNNDQRAE